MKRNSLQMVHKYLDISLLIVLGIGFVFGVKNMVLMFGWETIGLQAHLHFSPITIVMFTMLAVLHLLDAGHAYINNSRQYSVVLHIKTMILLIGLVFSIAITNGTYVDLLP
jgi:hypothetical protein